MALVVFGHGAIGWFHPDVNHALSNVRMPLLLCLAGMHFRAADSPLTTAWRKADALLKPYAMLALLLALYAWHRGEFQHSADAWQHLLHVVTLNGADMPGWLFPAWFLSLLWALHVGASALRAVRPQWLLARLTRLLRACKPIRPLMPFAPFVPFVPVLQMGALGAGLTLLWLLGAAWMTEPELALAPWLCVGSGVSPSGWPLNLDLLPLGAACFALGAWGRHELAGLRPDGVQAVCWTWVSAAIYLQWRPELHLLEREVHAPWASLLLACTGGLAMVHWGRVMALSRWAHRLLAPLGRYSIYILLTHAPVQWASYKALLSLGWVSAPAAAWLAGLAVIISGAALGRAAQNLPGLMLCFEPWHRVQRKLQAHPRFKPSDDLGARSQLPST